jgi:hypothetical protein
MIATVFSLPPVADRRGDLAEGLGNHDARQVCGGKDGGHRFRAPKTIWASWRSARKKVMSIIRSIDPKDQSDATRIATDIATPNVELSRPERPAQQVAGDHDAGLAQVQHAPKPVARSR